MSPCLPAVYIFVLRCLYPGTDKHNLIGYPQLLLLEEMAAVKLWAWGVGWEGQGCCRSTPTLHPPSTPLHMQPLRWELWQRFVHNWKLQFTESNYPEHDFPNIPPSVGLSCLYSAICFWRVLLCFCLHSQSAPVARSRCMAFGGGFLFRELKTDEAVFSVAFIILRRRCHRQQSGQPRSVMITVDNRRRAVLCCEKLLRRQKPSQRCTRLP